MKTVIVLLGIAFAIVTSDAAHAQRLPTDTELRAAYCVRVLTNDINILRQGSQESERSAKAAEERAKSGQPQDIEILRSLQNSQSAFQRLLRDRVAVLNRIELYILPRLERIESIGMLAAMTRANADIEAMNQESDDWVKCQQACGTDPICDARCRVPTPPDLQARLDGCRKPDWLPF